MEELLDTFDETMRWTGVATRAEVHRLGLWHQTFHCWVLHRDSSGHSLILQRRHRTKDTHPNKLDVSCAGHLSAGESEADGVRELREELGIDVNFARLHKVGVITDSSVVDGVTDNEFCHVFVLIRESQPLIEYKPAIGEVSGLYLVRVTDLQKLCRHEVDKVTIEGFELDDHGERHDRVMTIRLSDMVENGAPYYELLFSKLDELVGA